MIRTTAIIFVGLIAANAAWAAPAQKYSVTLAKPVASDTEVIAEGNIFQCKGTACNLVSAPIDAGSVYTCRKVAREVGEITAYGNGTDNFDAGKLAKCNGK